MRGILYGSIAKGFQFVTMEDGNLWSDTMDDDEAINLVCDQLRKHSEQLMSEDQPFVVYSYTLQDIVEE